MHLIIDYPWYFYLLVVMLGAAYAALLYFLPLRGKRGTLEGRIRLPLALLRMVAVSLLAFLLLSPSG